jgi:BON domain
MERCMDLGMNRVSSVRSIKVVAPLLLTAVLGWSAVAPAQSTDQNQAPATAAAAAAKTMPDAAVEANVLKALAGAPDLANQPMTTTTVYGVVTLSGSVESEALRVEAETIVSKTKGVQKVVDEMTLGGENANAQPEGNLAPAPPAAQAQAPIEEGSPDSDNTGNANQAPNQAPNQSANPAVQQPYGAPPPGYAPAQAQPVYGGQEGGVAVTVPAGALLRMRINQTLTSASAKAGDRFDGIVVNDVVAGGAVAIPRGAAVQGTVVDAKKSGALSGRGELTLQLTQVTLGGKSYAIVSDVWGRATGDKAAQSVNSTAAGGVMGALIGAAAGGGRGAAIGAGVGGALGLGSAATSGSGQVYVPSEGLLTFHLAQPATVTTLSQAEMDRLAQGVPQGMQPQQLRRRYPPVYYGPYGPGYYRPYPYGYPYPY